MDNFVKIIDKPLVRDIRSKAILSTDNAGLNEYLMKKEIAQRKQLEEKQLEKRIDKLEQNMEEIKELLKGLISHGS